MYYSTIKYLLVNEKGDAGMAKHFYKKYGTWDELSNTLYLQSEINLCSVRMPVNV